MDENNKFREDLLNNNFSIETTKERRNKTICPRTVADAVYINEEETLAERLNNISELINSLEDYLNPLEVTDMKVNGNSERTVYPLGMNFYSLSIEWDYNKDISYQLLNGEKLDSEQRSYIYPDRINPKEPTVIKFTLEAKDKRINKVVKKEMEISFQNYIYITTSINENYPSYVFDNLESRQNKVFIEEMGNTYNASAYEGYIWVAIPLRFLEKDDNGYRDITFTVNGFNGGFIGGVSNPNYIMELSNETSFKETYVLYRSNQPKLGYTEFTINK